MDALVTIPRSAPPISVAAARAALAQATDLSAVTSFIDRLEVIRVAARKAKLSLDAQNDWAVLKLEAERQAGRILTDLRARGDLRPGRPNADGVSALSELAVSQQQSSRWQRLAAVPDDRFARWVEETRARDDEVTEAGLFAVAARVAPSRSFGPLNITPAPTPGCVPRNVVLEGDCLPILRTLPDACVDALVTDPPYGLEFMESWDDFSDPRTAVIPTESVAQAGISATQGLASGVRFNSGAAANRNFQAWVEEWARECYRILKPGAYLLAFGGARTYHRLSSGIEDAGFEVRDQLLWVYESGFPKSLSVGKALEAVARTGTSSPKGQRIAALGDDYEPTPLAGTPGYGTTGNFSQKDTRSRPLELNDDDAKQWSGWGTATKPAFEPIVMARKPLIGPVVENVLTFGTGALNIDGCRMPGDALDQDATRGGTWSTARSATAPLTADMGRWPSNLLLTDPVFDGAYPDEVIGGGPTPGALTPLGAAPLLPGKSRFFLVPKADAADRWAILNCACTDAVLSLAEIKQRVERLTFDDGNHEARCRSCGGQATIEGNPCVKPLSLMRHLCRLVCRAGGLILDPFAGTGTTGVAAHDEGCDYLLIERDPGYAGIARARLERSVAS